MAHPTAGDYQEVLQVPEAAFADPELQRGEPEADVLGLPRAITGAYAAVFPIRTRAGRVAVKCFLSHVPGQRSRYKAIEAHLEEVELEAAVAFDYQPKGVRVEGRHFPLLKMPWVDGTPLNHFVEAHREAPDVMQALGEAWERLVGRLEKAQMAHGDLQHGNVLVTGEPSAPQLRLVDLDTCFVPALAGRPSPEVGHRNYQHPDRDERAFGPYLDRFAALVVYTAIQAVRAEPGLWERHDTGENLLFRAADFYDPEASVLFDELLRLEAVRPLAEQLRRACLLEPRDVPPLAAVLRGEVLPPSDHKPRSRRAAGVRPSRSVRRWRALLMGFVALVLTATVVFYGGVVGAVAVLVLVIGALVEFGRRYRRLPPVRRRRRLRSEVAYYDELIERLDEEVGHLERERSEAVEGVEARRAQRLEELREEALYDHLKHHFVHEAAAVEELSHKVIVRLKAAALRTAYDVTPEALERVREVGEGSTERLLAWRQSLVERYADALPERLSPAQERRLENVLRHRLLDLDAARQRAREKRRVQQEERGDVLARLQRVPHVHLGRYAASLLGLTSLPDDAGAPPIPRHRPTTSTRRGDPRGGDESGEETATGRATDAWWRQAS